MVARAGWRGRGAAMRARRPHRPALIGLVALVASVFGALVAPGAEPALRATLAASDAGGPAEPSRPCTVAAAGDIAEAGGDQEATAGVVASLDPTAVLTLGDNAYDSGSASEFRTYYDPSWGRFKAITHPAVGNHEYQTPGAAGYLDYFGVQPYYAYDVCGWHAYSLNREISGAERDAELAWLRADLAAHRGVPMLAVWHEPRWTSGTKHGSDGGAADLWEAVVAGGVRVVLNGHEHSYERFAELDAQGRPAPGGTREFIVGEGGGGDLSAFGDPLAASQARISGAHGVLSLTLRPDGYDWRLVQVGGTVADQGSQALAGSVPAPSPSAPSASPPASSPSAPSASPPPSSPSAPSASAPATVRYWWLAASQAAYVRGTEPAAGFGALPDLQVDGTDGARYLAFVGFDLGTFPAGVAPVSGRLYLHASTDLPGPVDVYAAPSTWSQATLTWATQPVFTPRRLGQVGPARAGDWVGVDVGPELRAGQQVSFVLTASTAGRSVARFDADGTASPPTLYLGTTGG